MLTICGFESNAEKARRQVYLVIRGVALCSVRASSDMVEDMMAVTSTDARSEAKKATISQHGRNRSDSGRL
jgi:hypothetical protein